MNLIVIAIIVIVTLIAVIALVLMDKGKSSDRRKKGVKLKNEIRSLRTMASSSDPSQRRDCLIKADSIFSKAMQLKLYNSSSAGENLKELRGNFDRKFYNEIWDAHKKRNRIVHDNEDVSEADAKRHLNTFIKSVDKLV